VGSSLRVNHTALHFPRSRLHNILSHSSTIILIRSQESTFKAQNYMIAGVNIKLKFARWDPPIVLVDRKEFQKLTITDWIDHSLEFHFVDTRKKKKIVVESNIFCIFKNIKKHVSQRQYDFTLFRMAFFWKKLKISHNQCSNKIVRI